MGRDGRVVEGGSLENCYRGNSIEGSNPSLSVSFQIFLIEEFIESYYFEKGFILKTFALLKYKNEVFENTSNLSICS